MTADRTFLELRLSLRASQPDQLERVLRIRADAAKMEDLQRRAIELHSSGGDAAGLVATKETERTMERVRGLFRELDAVVVAERANRSSRFPSARWVPIALLRGTKDLVRAEKILGA